MANKPLTPKQEKFCLKYIETGNASEAYRQAYNCENMQPQTINKNANVLLQNNQIATRVSEIQQIHVKRHMVTVDSLTAELEELKELAKQEGQISAGVSAVMGKAKIHGFDKVVVDANLLTTVKIINMTGKKDA